VRLKHRFHVGDLVAGHDEEMSGVPADSLVVWASKLDLLGALGICALAEVELDRFRAVSLVPIRYPLIGGTD